jgi:tripeptidyl-peptidase-1
VYGHESGQEHVGKQYSQSSDFVNFTSHVACDSYHLPEHVQSHVDFVTPTVHFDAKISKRSSSSSPDGFARSVGQPGHGTYPKTTGEIQSLLNQLETCDQQITPICLRALYGLVYEPLAADKNSYGIGKLSNMTLGSRS